jgi:putative ABC transport system ATP-binding protein
MQAGDADQAGDGRVIFHLSGISKQWSGPTGFTLDVDQLSICAGERVALVGFSGCGKSTLLDMLAMILKPDRMNAFDFDAGGDALDVAETWGLGNVDRLARARLKHIGYVLQTGGLLPFLSVRDNIGLNCRGLGLAVNEAVEPLADKLGITRHLDKLPQQLSVGERQRVAVARAMAHEPAVVIADEPTASLDPINADEIMKIFTRLVEDSGVALIVATHDWDLVERLGFRKLSFDLLQEPGSGMVRATVSGG